MNVQFYQTQYVIDCNEGDLDRTVFTILKFKSYSPEKWKNSYFGLFVDDDLGCSTNDGFGYDEETNSVYSFNVGGYDSDACHTDQLQIDDIHSVVKAMVFDDELSSLVETRGNNSSKPYLEGLLIYNRLRGFFDDGTAVTYGGVGFDPTSTDTVKFLFPDFPNDPNGWSMETIETIDRDMRFTPSFSLNDILPGSIHQFEYAELMMVDGVSEGLDIFNTYRSRIVDMQDARLKYIADEIMCPKFEVCKDECVWPGDANNNGKVDNDDFLYIAAAQNYPAIGQRENIDNLWYPHHAEDWGTNASTIDFKHSECNGNGIIDNKDLNAVELNFGLKNDSYTNSESQVLIGDPFGIYFTNLKEEYTSSGSGSFVFAMLKIGDEYDQLSEPIIGLSYDMSWDTSKMVLIDVSQPSVGKAFENNIDVLEIGESPFAQQPDEDDKGLTTKIHNANFNFSTGNTTEGGLLSQLRWKMNENLTTNNIDGRDTVDITFTDIKAINEDGELIEVGLRESYRIVIKDIDVVSSTNNLESIDRLTVFPNPVKDILYFDCEGCGTISEVNLFSYDGRLLYRNTSIVDNQLDINQLTKGLYILKVEARDGIYYKRVLVE